MPLDFMQKSLQAKQGKWDKQEILLDTLADMDIDALPGPDKKRAQELLKEIETFASESRSKDLGSSEYAREFQKFQRKIKNNKDLKKISSAYNKEAARQALKKEWQKKAKPHIMADVFGESDRAYRAYIARKNFSDDQSLVDAEDIVPGVKKIKESKEFFEHVSEDQIQDIITGETIKGKSREKLTQIGDSLFSDWVNSSPGKQYEMVFDNKNLESFGVVTENQLDNETKKHKVTETDNQGNTIDVIDPETGKVIMETDYEYYTRHKDNWLKDEFRDIALSFASEKFSMDGSGGSGRSVNIGGGNELDTVQTQVVESNWDDEVVKYENNVKGLNNIDEQLAEIERIQSKPEEDRTDNEKDYLMTTSPEKIKKLKDEKYELTEKNKRHTNAINSAINSYMTENNVEVIIPNEDGSFTNLGVVDNEHTQHNFKNALKTNDSITIKNQNGETEEITIKNIWDNSQAATKEELFPDVIFSDSEEGLTDQEKFERRKNDPNNYKYVNAIPTEYIDPEDQSKHNLRQQQAYLSQASPAAKAKWEKRVKEYNERNAVKNSHHRYVKIPKGDVIAQHQDRHWSSMVEGWGLNTAEDKIKKIESLSDKELQLLYLEREKNKIKKQWEEETKNLPNQAAIDQESFDEFNNEISDLQRKLYVDKEIKKMITDPVEKAKMIAHYNKDISSKSSIAYQVDKNENKIIYTDGTSVTKTKSADSKLETLLINDGLKNDIYVEGNLDLPIISGGSTGNSYITTYDIDAETKEIVKDEAGKPKLKQEEISNFKIKQINNVAKALKNGDTPQVEAIATYTTWETPEGATEPKKVEKEINVLISANTAKAYPALKNKEFLSDYYSYMKNAERSTGNSRQQNLISANKAMSNYIQFSNPVFFNELSESGLETMRNNSTIPFTINVPGKDGIETENKIKYDIKKTEMGYIVTPIEITDGVKTKSDPITFDNYGEVANLLYMTTDPNSELYD
jgi:hypothetical protein